MTVVVDSSVALKWVVHEEGSDKALELWDYWQGVGEVLTAPPIFRPEVTNVLFQKTRQGVLTLAEASEALEYLALTVAINEPEGVFSRALIFAHEFGLQSAYDALYLALADYELCEFWTADLRLVRSVRRRFYQIRPLGDQP